MSNISLVIEERAARIGHFMVGRLLPFRQKRSVGPFVFIDHMGPVQMNEGDNFDVLPHPHIGLSTLTYLFDGAIMHRDSLGTKIEIKPGAVNWMTAGKGVVHSERTPGYLRQSKKVVHGFQIWVALPKELEEMDPYFDHTSEEEIPCWEEAGLKIKLIAGEAFGKKSPVPVHSPLYFVEIKSKAAQKVNLVNRLYGENALYILEGSIAAEGNTYRPKQIIIAHNGQLCAFDMAENTIIYMFGGNAFPEERFIDWNFVSTSKERLKKAREDWVNQAFPSVSGETEYVPYPT